jgi:hypothetical protein
MSHDDQVGLQLTGKKRDPVHRIANREMGSCDYSARCELLDSIPKYLSRRLLKGIERHGYKNPIASHSLYITL